MVVNPAGLRPRIPVLAGDAGTKITALATVLAFFQWRNPRAGAMKGTISREATGLLAFAGLLMAGFGAPLCELARRALDGEVYLYVLVIPFVSAYLVCLKRGELAFVGSERSPKWGLVPGVLGGLLVGGYWWAARSGWKAEPDDYLALMTLSFVLLFWCGCFVLLGRETLRRVAFAVAFLVFMVPLPVAARQGIEGFFQRGSADAAEALFRLSGMPVLRQGTEFHLPGFALDVAPQCSGVHSSLVLFVLSCLAGYLFLKSPWRRAVLTLAVIPLGIVRNGVRIVLIGQLCVRVGPSMIHSWIHHRGGPLFFALSLVPFFLLLYVLRRSESRNPPKGNGVGPTLRRGRRAEFVGLLNIMTDCEFCARVRRRQATESGQTRCG